MLFIVLFFLSGKESGGEEKVEMIIKIAVKKR